MNENNNPQQEQQLPIDVGRVIDVLTQDLVNALKRAALAEGSVAALVAQLEQRGDKSPDTLDEPRAS